jgi:hypothetical protein
MYLEDTFIFLPRLMKATSFVSSSREPAPSAGMEACGSTFPKRGRTLIAIHSVNLGIDNLSPYFKKYTKRKHTD